MTTLAAMCAAVTLNLVLAPRRTRLAMPPGPQRVVSRRFGLTATGTGSRRRPVLVAGLGVIALGVMAPRIAPLAVTIGAVLFGIRRMRGKARDRASAAARRQQVIEACAVLASDLRAGRTPTDALAGAGTVCSELAPAVSAARLGDDIAVALDEAATAPGASGLRAVAAGWRVAEQSGAALAAVVERIAAALRADEQARRQVVAGLAGTRATGRLLAGLPVLGLLLGHAVGADPLGFLTATPIGWLCLTAGLALAGAGLTWIERLADGGADGLR